MSDGAFKHLKLNHIDNNSKLFTKTQVLSQVNVMMMKISYLVFE